MDYKQDYYMMLGVCKMASKEELKAAYRRLAKIHHPDKNPGDEQAAEKFRVIQEAYEVLSNDVKRHVYDEYRDKNKESNRTKTGPNETKKEASSPLNSRTHTKTRKVFREKRIYVQGTIQVKFQGDPERMGAYLQSKEQNYTLYPTESQASIISSGIYQDGTSREYERAYSSADLFAVQLPQPIQCSIKTMEAEELYAMTIHDIKIKNPVITNITRHEEYNFGELRGDFYGYIVHISEEEVTETFTEYFGATGQVETKESAETFFTRQEYFNKDGSRYWGEWMVKENIPRPRRPAAASSTVHFRKDNPWKYVGWIVLLFLGLVAFPKLFIGILLYLLVVLLIWTAGTLGDRLKIGLPFIAGLFFIFFIAVAIRSLFNRAAPLVDKPRMDNQPAPETRRTVLNDSTGEHLIRHTVRWSDYDSNQYVVTLSISESAVRGAEEMHRAISIRQPSDGQPGAIYRRLLQNDTGRLLGVYQAFDSIVQANNMNELQATQMIVSCIQSIPYYLVVDQSCSSEYADDFISNYLRNCQSNCCLGNVPFGVQSPVEFAGNLKGDCDTRALILFDILSQRGTDVAMLTSQVYKHAIIAVHFKQGFTGNGLAMPVDKNNYYLWETTSGGHPPGQIPASIANLDNWTISLIHQQ